MSAKHSLIAYALVALVFLALDALWLGTMASRLYRPAIGHLMAERFAVGPALAFYALYLGGVVYFAVADVEATVASAERAGGRILQRDFDSPYGRMADLADPDGARFSVLESSGDDGPDRSG